MAKAKAPTRVTLGEQYTDAITGFLGTAMCRQTTKNGCVLVHIKPRVGVDPSVMPKGEWVYETQLETSDGLRIDSKPEKETLKLLRKRYRDPNTGYVGFASSHIESFNGHVQLQLDGPLKLDGGMGEAWTIDVQDLIEVETEKPAAAPKPERGPLNAQVR